jgi:hypothetical protein
MEQQSIRGCVQDSPDQTSTPSGYNWAACSCTSMSRHSRFLYLATITLIPVSCVDLWCPAEVTANVLPYMSYFCALATGGSPSPPDRTAATATATGTEQGISSRSMGTGMSTATGTQPSANPAGTVLLEPILPIGVATLAAVGILAVML